jgi:transposase
MVIAPELLPGLNAKQLRELARDLIAQIASRDQAISARDPRINERESQLSERDQQIASLDQTISSKDREILYRQAKIDQLTHEMAVLKRWKFGRSREQQGAGQVSLLD